MVSFNPVSSIIAAVLQYQWRTCPICSKMRKAAGLYLFIAGLLDRPFRIDQMWSLLNRSFLVLSRKSVPPSGHVIYISPYSRFNTTCPNKPSNLIVGNTLLPNQYLWLPVLRCACNMQHPYWNSLSFSSAYKIDSRKRRVQAKMEKCLWNSHYRVPSQRAMRCRRIPIPTPLLKVGEM